MENKKFLVYTFFLILSGILINNIEVFIYQNNSKRDLQNVGHYNESSTAPFGTLTQSQSESEHENQGIIRRISIFNSMGVVADFSEVGSTSYPGENLTINFELYDINLSRIIDFDENNPISFLIKYNNTGSAMLNGTLLNHINFNNNTKQYNGIIETYVLTNGTYNITIFINSLNYTFIPYSFKLTIKPLTYIVNINFSDQGGTISELPYSSFIGSNISIEFKLLELIFNHSYFIDEDNQTNYQINYSKITGTRINGILSNQISYDNDTKIYSLILGTSVLSEGTYRIKITIEIFNKTLVPYSFNFNVRKKYKVVISINKPSETISGERYIVTVYAQYGEDSEYYFLVATYIRLTLNINDGSSHFTSNKRTDNLGRANFVFILPLSANKISLNIEVPSAWNRESLELEITDIKIIPSLNFIVTFIILIGLIISLTIVSFLAYMIFLNPKKREKTRFVNVYKQIFEDLSNLECIFINFKTNRKIIFYKSYTAKKINQEKIGNYMSSLSNLKGNLKSQLLIQEISYKDKILIFSNGKYIEASLVLNKKGSAILKKNLKEFIYDFENYYENFLENSKDNIILSKKIESIFEEKLNFFLVLKYEIENSHLHKLLNSNSKYLLKLTQNLIRETGENCFYISTLLNEFLIHSHKGISKFFLGFQDLRKDQIFTTIH